MANEPMELAKNFDPKKTPFPAIAQVKYDGVPVVFNSAGAWSRQNERVVSVGHIEKELEYLTSAGWTIVAECLIPGEPFKVSSGAVRKQQNNQSIIGMIFDGHQGDPSISYAWRISKIKTATMGMEHVRTVSCHIIGEAKNVEAMWDHIKDNYSNPEGMMMHDVSKPFRPGKRCWGMARYKPQPTIDLEVVGFEEAMSESGEPLGMVGRVNVKLVRSWPIRGAVPKGWDWIGRDLWSKVVGIGPGKMTHAERIKYWAQYRKEGIPMSPIAEIKYMRDDTYDALRQPTFQRWRHEKTEPDILEY